MIEKLDAMALLVEACPSFAESWHEHLQENGNDLLYVAAGSFAEHLLWLYKSNDLSSFPAVAAVLERLHVEGTAWVKELATIGVLEGVQNVWASNNENPEHFRAFLGKEAQRGWESLNKFWSGEAPYVGGEG